MKLTSPSKVAQTVTVQITRADGTVEAEQYAFFKHKNPLLNLLGPTFYHNVWAPFMRGIHEGLEQHGSRSGSHDRR